MKRVDSTNLARVGYESGTLQIEFKKGEVYQYFNVPENIYNGLMLAGSHGEYFNENIRGKFKYQKIR